MLVLCQFTYETSLEFTEGRSVRQEIKGSKVIEVHQLTRKAIDAALVKAGFRNPALESYLPNTANPSQPLWDGKRMPIQGEGGVVRQLAN